jgi:hypothetical protein
VDLGVVWCVCVWRGGGREICEWVSLISGTDVVICAAVVVAQCNGR